MLLFSTFIYYVSYLLIPIVVLFLVATIKANTFKFRIVFFACVVFFSLGIYVRFIEPQIIVFQHESFRFPTQDEQKETTQLRMVVFADPHLGIFKRGHFLTRVVEKVNSQNPDLVLIPGDFIHDITREELHTFFTSLQDINAPTYAVAGNHDSESPGDITSQEVRDIIQTYGIVFVDNKKEEININNAALSIYGLSDLWENKIDQTHLNTLTTKEHSILLIHNPDTIFELENTNADLILAGHTHGGQVRIPWIYKKAIPTRNDFDRDWYNFENIKLFITSGVGETGLPLRFLVPPEIVVFDVTIPKE